MKKDKVKTYNPNSISNLIRRDKEIMAGHRAEKGELEEKRIEESKALENNNLKPSERMIQQKEINETKLERLKNLSREYREIAERFTEKNSEDNELKR